MSLNNLSVKFNILYELIYFSIAFNFLKDTSFINKATRVKFHHQSKKISKRSLIRIVLRGAKILGIKKCLVISMVIFRILKRHGYSAKLIIGWHMTDKFSSHSWVESDSDYFPQIEIENSKKYKKIKAFE